MIHKPDLLISNHSTPLSFFVSLGKYHQYAFGSLTFKRSVCFHVVKFSITSAGSRDGSFLCKGNWDILSQYFLQAIFVHHDQLFCWEKREGKASTQRKAADRELALIPSAPWCPTVLSRECVVAAMEVQSYCDCHCSVFLLYVQPLAKCSHSSSYIIICLIPHCPPPCAQPQLLRWRGGSRSHPIPFHPKPSCDAILLSSVSKWRNTLYWPAQPTQRSTQAQNCRRQWHPTAETIDSPEDLRLTGWTDQL